MGAVFDDLDELLAAPPVDLGVTPWVTVEAEAVEQFARATLSPPTETVPPFMLLSLTNLLMPHLLQVPGASSGVNYGTESVRFASPVRPGDRLRGQGFLVEASEAGGGVQTKVHLRVELEGADEPACTVESLSRWMR
jgi:acyl dehydratase